MVGWIEVFFEPPAKLARGRAVTFGRYLRARLALGCYVHGWLGGWAAGQLGVWASEPLGGWAAGRLGGWASGRLSRWAAGRQA
jgi:hypothetical protein